MTLEGEWVGGAYVILAVVMTCGRSKEEDGWAQLEQWRGMTLEGEWVGGCSVTDLWWLGHIVAARRMMAGRKMSLEDETLPYQTITASDSDVADGMSSA
jgi:hypothetical protein